MKRLMIAAVMMGLGGGAYAADFGDLGGVKAAGLGALAAAENIVAPDANKGYAAGNGTSAGVDIELLKNTQFSCEVVYVHETENGDVRSDFRPVGKVEFTTHMWGGDPYGKCAVVPTMTPAGKMTSMDFGCFNTTGKHVVKVFNEKHFKAEVRDYNWELDFDLQTGMGRISYDYTLHDWSHSSHYKGNAELKACRVVKPVLEPALY